MFERIKHVFRRHSIKNKGHAEVKDYWKAAKDTHIGKPSYYDLQEETLRDIMRKVASVDQKGLDIGCGDGRFSRVMAEYLSQVLALDLSENLINLAVEKSKKLNVKNVDFEVQDLEDGLPREQFAIVACMGVTSSLLKEEIFNGFLHDLRDVVADGGVLITKVSVSTLGYDQLVKSGQYVAIYRERSRYENSILSAGFDLVQVSILSKAKTTTNNMYLWTKKSNV